MGWDNLGYLLYFAIYFVVIHILLPSRVYIHARDSRGNAKRATELLSHFLLSLTLAARTFHYKVCGGARIFWAGQIGVEMSLSIPLIGEWIAQLLFGGFTLSQSTLQRMYILHVFLLPFV